MPQSLNTWYLIAFESEPGLDGVFVTVTQDDAVPDGHFTLELESDMDPRIEKVRLESDGGASLALCSNAFFCHNGTVEMGKIEADTGSQRVSTPPLNGADQWIVPDKKNGGYTLTVYFTKILYGEDPLPCDDWQPDMADPNDHPDWESVGAYPMVFAFPGENPGGGNTTGKKVKIIWQRDL